jgi:hypothetical protein
MKKKKELLTDFVNWLREQPQGVFYAFDETEQAIDEFFEDLKDKL